MEPMQAAVNITGVRDNLLIVFNALCGQELESKEAVEINNTAGKIISSLKVQLAYHAMRGEKPEIEFLNSEPTMKTVEHASRKLHAPKDKK
jgi:hypothetical protein